MLTSVVRGAEGIVASPSPSPPTNEPSSPLKDTSPPCAALMGAAGGVIPPGGMPLILLAPKAGTPPPLVEAGAALGLFNNLPIPPTGDLLLALTSLFKAFC